MRLDWLSSPSLGAVFQTLPGAGFIVNGAVAAKDAALASAGAALRLANGMGLIAKLDGSWRGTHRSTLAPARCDGAGSATRWGVTRNISPQTLHCAQAERRRSGRGQERP